MSDEIREALETIFSADSTALPSSAGSSGASASASGRR